MELVLDDRTAQIAAPLLLPRLRLGQPLPIRKVVVPAAGPAPEGVFSGDGKNIDSANAGVSLNGLPTAEAKRTIVAWLKPSLRATSFELSSTKEPPVVRRLGSLRPP